MNLLRKAGRFLLSPIPVYTQTDRTGKIYIITAFISVFIFCYHLAGLAGVVVGELVAWLGSCIALQVTEDK